MTAVKSALRTLQILEVFDGTRQPMTLAELARALGSPKSSTLALIQTLSEQGYLYRVSSDDGYYPTRRWLQHAQGVVGSDPIAARIRQALVRLRDATGETAIHAVLADDHTVYLDVVESTDQIRFSAQVGEGKPIPLAASGRALLGAMSPEDRQRLVERLPAAQFRHPLTRGRETREALLARIARERAEGWSLNRGEYQPDVTSAAAGLLINGTPHALVIGAPYQRLEGRFDAIGRILQREAAKLASTFGWAHA